MNDYAFLESQCWRHERPTVTAILRCSDEGTARFRAVQADVRIREAVFGRLGTDGLNNVVPQSLRGHRMPVLTEVEAIRRKEVVVDLSIRFVWRLVNIKEEWLNDEGEVVAVIESAVVLQLHLSSLVRPASGLHLHVRKAVFLLALAFE